MADGTLTSESGITVTDVQPGTAVTDNNGTQAPVVGSGTQLGEDTLPKSEGGSSQEPADDGQSQTSGRRKWTPIDEIRELRASRRESRQRESALQDQLRQLTSQLDEIRQLQQPRQRGTARTPADFWQDPEGTLSRNLDDRLAALEDRMLSSIQMTREQEAFQMNLAREQEGAVEFIRSQPNYAPEDDEDIIDIIESIPAQTRESLSPQWVAEYAWMKLNAERGVGNRSVARARASTVVGQPPGVGLGQKVWSKSEFDATVDLLEKQGIKADPKLISELESAVKEGRVR